MTGERGRLVSAVHRSVADVPKGALVLVGCSGGADSVALAAATARAARGAGWHAGAVVVDHGLQEGSAGVAERAAEYCAELGLDPVGVRRAAVDTTHGGLEAAARAARYATFEHFRADSAAECILLGHTRDDQAETVLLGLARGSGPRSLAGMPARRDSYRRPFLNLSRAVVRAAYPEAPVWEDPHNHDPARARARVRHEVLPALELTLGPGVAEALARTAAQAQQDCDALDAWADTVAAEAVTVSPNDVTVSVVSVADLPVSVVVRVMRRAAKAAGVPSGRLAAPHLDALGRLISHWHGQGPLDLPGNVQALRRSGKVVFRTTPG